MRDRKISYLSLLIAIIALAYTAWLHGHANEMAEQALRKREAQLVEKWTPKVDRISRDILGAEAFPDTAPQTIDELFSPLTKVLEGI